MLKSFFKLIFVFFIIFSMHFLISKNYSNFTRFTIFKNSGIEKASLISSCFLKKIVDGDTVWVRCYVGFKANQSFKVRFADINAPELETKPGKESKKFLERFFESHSKRILLCVDNKKIYGKYHRVVAVVLVPINDSCYININKYLMDKGYAEPVDYYNSFHPWQWKSEIVCRKNLCSFDNS